MEEDGGGKRRRGERGTDCLDALRPKKTWGVANDAGPSPPWEFRGLVPESSVYYGVSTESYIIYIPEIQVAPIPSRKSTVESTDIPSPDPWTSWLLWRCSRVRRALGNSGPPVIVSMAAAWIWSIYGG